MAEPQNIGVQVVLLEDVQFAREIGRTFAREWAGRTEQAQVRAILDGFPNLQKELDIELLHAAEDQLGSLRRRPDIKSELRGAFWSGARRAPQTDERSERTL